MEDAQPMGADHPLDDIEEQRALGRVVLAFQEYGARMEWEIGRWERNFHRLPERHKALLASLPRKAAEARRAAHVNQLFLKSLLQAFHPGSGGTELANLYKAASCSGCGHGQGGQCKAESGGGSSSSGTSSSSRVHTSPGDFEKVKYVLKNLVRDWGEEGAAERAASYGRITAELKARLPVAPPGCGGSSCSSGDAAAASSSGRPPRVLVPGAGLGRLCVELAAAGYECQGNEFSYFMLLASSFMLNSAGSAAQWTIHPWVAASSNQLSDEDQMRPVALPDTPAADMVPGPGLLSMCAGDFAEVYARPEYGGAFDAVATCFFIDTAHNVLAYLEVIAHVLRPGGLWINLGPLLYHWADAHTYLEGDELSVELSQAELLRCASALGFTMLRQPETVDAAYLANPRAMHTTSYRASFWTMQKPAARPGEGGPEEQLS